MFFENVFLPKKIKGIFMKKCILIILILPCFISPAEIELKRIPSTRQEPIIVTASNINEIANNIDKAIKNAQPTRWDSLWVSKNRELDHLNILKTPQTLYPSLEVNMSLVKTLIKLNEYFADAIEYFSKLEYIDCNTLALMDNPQEPPQLRLLPENIRSRIMKDAHKNLHETYHIHINSSSPIKLCNISATKHMAVTYNEKKEIQLWNLRNNKSSFTIANMPNVTALAFNNFNAQLFIGCSKKNDPPTVHIWNLESQKIDSSFTPCQSSREIEQIQSAKLSTTSFLISVYLKEHEGTHSHTITQWITSEDGNKHIQFLSNLKGYHEYIKQDCYETRNPKYKGSFATSKLVISNKVCMPLYFCLQAAKSVINQKDGEKIMNSLSYNSLSEYEKEFIQKKIKDQVK